MADDNTLSALVRTSFGKGAARKIRANDQIPAVIYGHGTDPQHVTLPGHETMLITRRSNALITLDIEGAQQLALVKDIQRDPVKQVIEHIDLIVVRQGEKVEVDVPVHIEGESAPGTIHSVELQSLAVESLATAIPTHIVVSVEGLEDGTVVRISDLQLPEGTTTDVDPESPVVVISVPHLEEELEELEAENAVGTDAAEGDDEASTEESDEA